MSNEPQEQAPGEEAPPPETSPLSGGPADPKEKAPKDKVWMVWKGTERDHTPPLPSRDLQEADVRRFLLSQEQVDSYVATGLWQSKVPSGALPASVPTEPRG